MSVRWFSITPSCLLCLKFLIFIIDVYLIFVCFWTNFGKNSRTNVYNYKPPLICAWPKISLNLYQGYIKIFDNYTKCHLIHFSVICTVRLALVNREPCNHLALFTNESEVPRPNRMCDVIIERVHTTCRKARKQF
jgi:hypothetical protein